MCGSCFQRLSTSSRHTTICAGKWLWNCTTIYDLTCFLVHAKAPPLPHTLPSLAASCHSGGSNTPLLLQAQKLLHSYPSSVWSVAALTHTLNPDRIKTQYQAVLLQYSECCTIALVHYDRCFSLLLQFTAILCHWGQSNGLSSNFKCG